MPSLLPLRKILHMSTNKIVGGVRTNTHGIIVNSNGVPFTEDELQALPADVKKALKIKKPKAKPKTKPAAGTKIPF